MADSFYFYDLETSGVSARRDRVMQFAGQRTDLNLKPVGEPDNILIKLTPDILPDPYAILVTGITPQQTIADGITEAEFLQYFTENIAVPGTTFVGFNNIRFDDEFMRFMHWRNFYDAYEWQWKDGRSRWDLLDMVRMTRALRPEGIKWPFAPDGKPSNRLELLSSVNKLEHTNAHDALSDVKAAISVATLIKTKQPKLFSYLLNVRDKQRVAALVGTGLPFIYTSGRYSSQFAHTSVAVKLADHPERGGAIVYDLRIDPSRFTGLKPEQLAEKWSTYGKDAPYFPVKALMYNRCPAIAPLSVLDKESKKRLKLDQKLLDKHLKAIPEDFGDRLVRAIELMNKPTQTDIVVNEQKVDELLYEGFVSGPDKLKMGVVRAAKPDDIADLELDFSDQRLQVLLPLYKARNFPKYLTDEQQTWWHKFRQQKIASGGEKSALAHYFSRLGELAEKSAQDSEAQYVLEELQLYGESIAPID